jgi:polar amino acid transport system substrate-binding protein
MRRMQVNFWMTMGLMLVLVLGSACAPVGAPQGDAPASEATPTAASSEAPATGDLLADIQARGVLRISTDPAYPPQSELVENVDPPADTKCTGEEKPANQFTGFDIDTAVELAKRLGVEPCFITPDWTLIVGGNWAGRWDISIGSVTITPERMGVLYFAQPYYTTPAAFFVHQDNTSYAAVEDLSGTHIGVCAGCTYEAYLDSSLEIPGETINFVVNDAEVSGYDTDTSALQDLALGDGVRLDAVLTALPTGQGFIADGNPIKQLGDPVYFEYLAPAIDRSSELDPTTFVAAVTEQIQAMHSDGTLKALSEQYYGTDLATPAASFDMTQLAQ